MEWESPAVVLEARPWGTGDAVVTVLTETQGLWRGLVKGGGARRNAGTWQPGNLVSLRWTARLAEQLGSLTGELVHYSTAAVMDDPLLIDVVAAVCAVAEGALPEREPHPRLFAGLAHLMARLPVGPAILAELVRWEVALLADLGFGLDLSACALSGSNSGLAYISPRTGRAVTAFAAGEWAPKLLTLPRFLLDEGEGAPADWQAGLRITTHFLARDVFGQTHRPLPGARERLQDRVERLTEDDVTDAQT